MINTFILALIFSCNDGVIRTSYNFKSKKQCITGLRDAVYVLNQFNCEVIVAKCKKEIKND